MGEEEGGFLPDFGEEIVEVIGSRCAGQRRDALAVGNVGQQAIVAIVDQFVLTY